MLATILASNRAKQTNNSHYHSAVTAFLFAHGFAYQGYASAQFAGKAYASYKAH
jgi:hypothetical protein